LGDHLSMYPKNMFDEAIKPLIRTTLMYNIQNNMIQSFSDDVHYVLEHDHGSRYLSIYGIDIAPLQGNYSEVLPAQAQAKRKVLSRL